MLVVVFGTRSEDRRISLRYLYCWRKFLNCSLLRFSIYASVYERARSARHRSFTPDDADPLCISTYL